MLDSIIIKIQDREYIVKKSYRSLMLFEEMSGRNIDEMKDSVNDLMLLFYCILKANNRDIFQYSFDEFIDVIDEHPDSVEVFNKYLLDEAKKIDKSSTKKKQKNQ